MTTKKLTEASEFDDRFIVRAELNEKYDNIGKLSKVIDDAMYYIEKYLDEESKAADNGEDTYFLYKDFGDLNAMHDQLDTILGELAEMHYNISVTKRQYQ